MLYLFPSVDIVTVIASSLVMFGVFSCSAPLVFAFTLYSGAFIWWNGTFEQLLQLTVFITFVVVVLIMYSTALLLMVLNRIQTNRHENLISKKDFK